MKKYISIALFSLVAIISLAFGVLFYLSQDVSKNESQPTITLSEEDISNLIKPAVVRIYTQYKGDAIIPYFDIDWANSDLVFPKIKKPFTLPVDETVTGSGFIVDPSGYIVTNAHVVSDLYVKEQLALEILKLRLAATSKSQGDQEKITKLMKDKGIDSADTSQFLQEFMLNLRDKLADSINISGTKNIVVLNPSSKETKLSDLIAASFPAKAIKINDDFFRSRRDVAILKIDKTNLPSLDLSDDETAKIGSQIYVLGFPASGQFNAQDILEPTFTQGIVSAVKDSDKDPLASFKIYETDAKVSSGSSGSPLIDKDGRAEGIITFATGVSAGDSGDGFAFTIPISLAKIALQNQGITLEQSKFRKYFTDGLLYIQNKQCKQASDAFVQAEAMDADFAVNKYIEPYVNICSNIVAAGGSVDSGLGVFLSWTKSQSRLTWVLVSALILLTLSILVITLIIIRLFFRMKKDEEEIKEFEDKIINR